MESTRNWLARAFETERAFYARGMATWLCADGEHGFPSGECRKLCRRILLDLIAWLREDQNEPVAGLLPRHARLARSFLLEALKQGGELESRSRRERVAALLTSFFGSESASVLPNAEPDP